MAAISRRTHGCPRPGPSGNEPVGGLDGTREGVDTPVGIVPAPGALDVTGLDMTDEDVAKALAVDPAEWQTELALIEEWLATFGDNLPTQMQDELNTLKANLGAN
ncbi:MAG TPA: phosphoenolpyruvate carboxykinase domain-containing protein [Candidatus Nanopelagicales bacterium]|nr:phosphoenolpyruvate carboxykinase domain-containing protein [Candidatus Nanopelagicales bacterium]